MKIIKPPQPLNISEFPRPWIFLAGAIDNGAAEEWQKAVESDLAECTGTILNPRRDNWDASICAADEHNKELAEQIRWESALLRCADHILMYFPEHAKAPISLLELGLYAKSGRMLVTVHPNFYRRANVVHTCIEYGVPQFDDVRVCVDLLKKIIG
jgi:hypothetical protein